MKKKLIVLPTLAAVILITALVFFGRKDRNEEDVSRLVVVSPHPTDFMIPLIREFENETGVFVEIRSMGTSNAIESIRNDTNIDVLWGGSLLTVGPYTDIFYPYESPNISAFKEEFKDVGDGITCFSDVPSIIMINTDIVPGIRIEGYEDLLQDELKGRIAFASPADSSSSFEHLVNMLYVMGEGDPVKGWDYVKRLAGQLDGGLLGGSSEVYDGVAGGRYVAGLTFEEAAVTMLEKNRHVRIVYMKEGVVSTPDGIYINKASDRLDDAKRFVDFMTSKNAQTYLAKKLGRRSVRNDVDDSGLVLSYKDINKAEVDRDTVIKNKELWTGRFMDIYKESLDEKR